MLHINSYDEYHIHKRALLCAELCLMSYNNETSNYKHKGIHICIKNKVSELKYKSIQFHIYQSKQTQILVIRGTDTRYGYAETLSDLLVSFRFIPTLISEGLYCHHGYSYVGQRIVEQLRKNNLIDKNKKLIITGHSLGGAIAKFISVHMEQDIDLYTFGAPQVAQQNYYSYRYQVDEHHYMNKHDWLCSFPSHLYNDYRTIYVMDGENINHDVIKHRGLLMPFIKSIGHGIFTNNEFLKPHALKTYISNLDVYTNNKL